MPLAALAGTGQGATPGSTSSSSSATKPASLRARLTQSPPVFGTCTNSHPVFRGSAIAESPHNRCPHARPAFAETPASRRADRQELRSALPASLVVTAPQSPPAPRFFVAFKVRPGRPAIPPLARGLGCQPFPAATLPARHTGTPPHNGTVRPGRRGTG